MKQYVPILEKVNRELDLPQPQKSRILLEIAADLDDACQYYRNKGFDEKEALKLAEEKIILSESALSDLSELHKPAYRRFLDKISEQTRSRWEKFLLLTTISMITYFIILLISQTPFFREASSLIYPSLFIFTVILGFSSVKFYQLYIKKDHQIRKLRSGMSLILFLGVFNLFLGLFGYFFELFRYSGKGLMMISYLLIIMTTDSAKSLQLLTETADAILKSSSMVMICIFVTLVSGFIWFSLEQKISKIEEAEALILLNN